MSSIPFNCTKDRKGENRSAKTGNASDLSFIHYTTAKD